MKSIFRKEIREQRLLALGIFTVMSAALAAVVLSNRRAMVVFTEDFQGVTITLFAVAGFLLGIFQTVPERLLGRWEFLVHRPQGLSRIFRAKAAAGLFLYFAAVLPPFLAALLWLAKGEGVEGHFHWRMILPGAADLLGGVLYYFAGLASGMRDRRLQTGRVIGPLIALSGTGAICLAPTFAWALAWAALVGGLLLAVAHGAFLRGGTFQGQLFPSRGALVFCHLLVFSALAAGVGLVIDAARWWVSTQESEEVFFQEMRADPVPWSEYMADKEGRFLRIVKEQSGTDPEPKLLSCDLLFGPPFPDGGPKEMTDIAELPSQWASGFHFGLYRSQGGPGWYRWGIHFRRYEGSREAFGRYYVPEDRLWHLYEYALNEFGNRRGGRRYLGALGVSGFSPVGGAVPERFPADFIAEFGTEAGSLLVFVDRVYFCGRGRETPRLLYGGEKGKVFDVVMGQDRDMANGLALRWLAILTEKGIQMTDLFGKETEETSFAEYPEKVKDPERRRVMVTSPVESKGFFVKYEEGCRLYGCGLDRADLIAYVEPGKGTVATFEVPSLVASGDVSGIRDPHRDFRMIWKGFAVPVAVALDRWGVAEWLLPGQPDDCPVCGKRLRQRKPFPLPVAVVLGAAGCGLALWFGRRHAFGAAALTAGGMLGAIFGLAGFLTMLAVCDWPARVACPGCGRRRIVAREACEHCGAVFPPPERDGTEIFEEGSAAGQKS